MERREPTRRFVVTLVTVDRGSARHAERRRLPFRIVGSIETIAYTAQHLGGRGLAPEPPRDLVAAGIRRRRKVAFEVERLEIVRTPADERRQRNVRATLRHVGIVARGEVLQEARDVVEARGGNAA